ncbi:type IV toxin-antitoxin system AbiEi family antitoxin domain-containing protein [Trujillonella humicola]|uniref:type IV toxin-antitoxin system AbiEi family antitoxin domain-containing protein n=1 Tax=Trujillonella humicola TaxID=3383699 RepID=UPI003906259C
MHPTLRAAAERRLGVFTAADVRAAGYDHAEVRRLCSSGAWARLRRGVYVGADELASAETSDRRHELDAVAVLAALDRPTAALSHLTACRLWGLPVRRDADPLVRLTDPTHTRTGRGFRVTCGPLTDDEVRTRGPFRLTSPARTLADCARDGGLDDAVVAMDAALLLRTLSGSELDAAVSAAARWPGGPRARRAAALAVGRAESPLETRGRLRIVGAGLPHPELQVEIRSDGCLVAVVDAWFDDAAVAVEFDGKVKYTEPWRGRTPAQVLWEEKEREDLLRSLDIGVVRITDTDLYSRWPRTEARLLDLTSRPGPALRRFTVTPRPQDRLRYRR